MIKAIKKKVKASIIRFCSFLAPLNFMLAGIFNWVRAKGAIFGNVKKLTYVHAVVNLVLMH